MNRLTRIQADLDLVKEWDKLAPVRYQQITSGRDLSYHYILVPTVINLLSNSTGSGVDAGCGIGYLTNILSRSCGNILGLDPSENSIAIARQNYGAEASFLHSTLQDFAPRNPAKYDFVVANMVLMDVWNLKSFIDSAYQLLKSEGIFIFTVTHPWFWPRYYGYENEPWFAYSRELAVESPFRITAEPTCPLYSTHIHRPLEAYIEAFREARFSIDTLVEPMPSKQIEALYPQPWKYPRYLAGRCRR
jgi:SAM-dependent methyltransferase